MATRIHRPHLLSRRLRWWRALRRWERITVVGVLLGALLVSAALIYFGPSLDANNPSPAAPGVTTTTTPGPLYPPGTRWYYRRSQWYQPIQPQP